MNSKEVRFKPREPVYKRFERAFLESTPQSMHSCNEQTQINSTKINDSTKAASETADSNKTVINSFRIEPCIANTKTQSHQNQQATRPRSRLLNINTSDDDDDSSSEDEEGSLFVNEDEFEDSESDDELDTLCLIDPECTKIVQGRDINAFYFSMVNWFNSLKDALVYTSTPIPAKTQRKSRRTQSNSSFKQFSSSIQRNSQSRQRLKNSASPQRLHFFCDHSNLITGDLKKDIHLSLKYEKLEHSKWNENDICRYLKYKYFIGRKNNFSDSLCIVPGIGAVYMNRLYRIIPNFGTLLELCVSVNEDTFKALLYAYANISVRNLNLICTACKNYLTKFGLDFRDSAVHIPKSFRFFEHAKSGRR